MVPSQIFSDSLVQTRASEQLLPPHFLKKGLHQELKRLSQKALDANVSLSELMHQKKLSTHIKTLFSSLKEDKRRFVEKKIRALRLGGLEMMTAECRLKYLNPFFQDGTEIQRISESGLRRIDESIVLYVEKILCFFRPFVGDEENKVLSYKSVTLKSFTKSGLEFICETLGEKYSFELCEKLYLFCTNKMEPKQKEEFLSNLDEKLRLKLDSLKKSLFEQIFYEELLSLFFSKVFCGLSRISLVDEKSEQITCAIKMLLKRNATEEKSTASIQSKDVLYLKRLLENPILFGQFCIELDDYYARVLLILDENIQSITCSSTIKAFERLKSEYEKPKYYEKAKALFDVTYFVRNDPVFKRFDEDIRNFFHRGIKELLHPFWFYKSLDFLLKKKEEFLSNPSRFLDLSSGAPDHLEHYNQITLYPTEPKRSSFFMDTQEYLNNRFSLTSLRFLKAHESVIEVFLGSKEDMVAFYKNASERFELSFEFVNPNATRLFVFYNQKGAAKVVALGISSPSRLKHFSCQLSQAGIEVPSIAVRGNFDRIYQAEKERFFSWFDSLAVKPTHLFLGSNILSKLKKEKGVKLSHDSHYHHLCKGSYGSFKNLKKTFSFLSFSMPNGELAGEFTRWCMEKGISTVIILGAAGFLGDERSKDQIGDYKMIYRVFMDEQEEIAIKESSIYKCPQLDFMKDSKDRHVTVSSPLEEDTLWVKKQLDMGVRSTDVELYHIFKALHKSSLKILPGLFLSDKINDEELSLTKKISVENAFLHIRDLAQSIVAFELS